VLERLTNNLGLKLLSLALAASAWAYLRFAPNPIIAAHFIQQLSVPITTTGLRPGSFARFTEKQAVVGVDVPRNGPAVRPDDLRAVLDLEGRGAGVYNVPIEVIAPKLEIRSLSPASVTLSIENVETRGFPITVRYVGDSHRNVVIDRVSIDPAYATLRAPSGDLARVVFVRVDLPFPNAPSQFDSMLRPVPMGEGGAEMLALDVSPNLVHVRATFRAAQATSK
jgi:hypothetical protein